MYKMFLGNFSSIVSKGNCSNTFKIQIKFLTTKYNLFVESNKRFSYFFCVGTYFLMFNNLIINYIFKGLAFETLGPWCKETIDFINVIGDQLIAESGDSKSKKFLFERISLAIQRGNAASIRGTFPDSALLSEIFAL
jgi:hypothetical protein